MVKTVDLDFSLMWLIGLIREQWIWNEVLLMSFFPYKIAIKFRISSEFVYMFPYSLQVHSPWALCGEGASFLHQDLCEVQEEHWCKYMAVSAFRGCLWMPPLTTVLLFSSRSCTITGLKATAQPSVISATKLLNVTRAWQDCIVFGVRSQWVTLENKSLVSTHIKDCISYPLLESTPERSAWISD